MTIEAAARPTPRGNVALVVENDPTDDARRLGDWLTGGGLVLDVVRPHAGDPLPADLDGYAALVVMGGGSDAYPDASGRRAAPWFDALDGLLRKAVRHKVPTLAICLGAQLLARALGGTVERSASGPEIGAKLVARRDVADEDPIFAAVPFAPDVLQWHRDEIVELPLNAVLLAASTHYPVQAFRIGGVAWGLQFHIECDVEMFAEWALTGVETLAELGLDGVELLERVDAVQDDVAEVWRPFAERFAALALGRLPQRSLPLLGAPLMDPISASYGSLARFGFTDNERTAALAGPDGLRLWDPAARRPADDATAGALDALYFAADPDLALFQLHRLVEAAGEEVRTAVLHDRPLRRRLVGVLGVSATLGDLLVANPDEWRVLQGSLNGSPHGELLGDASTVPSLRSGYRRELLRIVAADLTGAADVEVTMLRLTELADATLGAALAIAQAEPGAGGCRLAVVAMGKCGGRELNYVSDVDVVFVAEPAAPDVETEAAVRAGSALAARMMEICGLVAWPVDAALRPEGSRGALVRTVASHLAYYRKWAKTWEFQALLKARPAAGDLVLGEQWLAELRPLIWSAAERPEAVDEVRAMRRRIVEAIPRAEVDREIKRGPGGLRDIEFAVQLLQLVHGRADESLRTPTTLAGLRALIEGGYVGLADGESLLRAYRFLRVVEHRLQLQRLRRTHTVPDDPAGLRWLAHALGYRPNAARDAVESFRAEWVRHAGEVRRLHAKLLYRPLLEAVARVPSGQLRLTPDAARARLDVLGFADPQGALRHLEALTGGVSRTALIQRQLLPVLLSEFADAPEPDRGLLAYRQVSEKMGNTPWYLRLLRDEGPVALRLARLLALSRYVTELLVHDPEALRLLADDAELVPRSAEVLTEGFAAAAARHDDPETAINAVRALRRRELFRIACADLLGRLDVTAVGVALSAITDATLRATLGTTPLPFCIIGMGRLGGEETSYPSDADVLFVYEAPPGLADDAASGAALSVAEELRRLLARPAPDPPLGVDADLRPEGRQGPLVRSLGAYQQYYARWSKIWEAQALLRARYVAGDRELADRFLALADTKRYPSGGLTREQVHEIRRLKARVDSERLPRGADPATHTKLGRGGLADVEWTVQLLQLEHGATVDGLRTPRTLAALSAATAAGLIDPADATALAAAWRQASTLRNLLTLVRGRATDQLPRQGPDLAAAARVLAHGAEPQEFLDDYLRVARRARQSVERIWSQRS